MAEMMGGSEEAQAQRLECQKQMDEGGCCAACMHICIC